MAGGAGLWFGSLLIHDDGPDYCRAVLILRTKTVFIQGES